MRRPCPPPIDPSEARKTCPPTSSGPLHQIVSSQGGTPPPKLWRYRRQRNPQGRVSQAECAKGLKLQPSAGSAAAFSDDEGERPSSAHRRGRRNLAPPHASRCYVGATLRAQRDMAKLPNGQKRSPTRGARYQRGGGVRRSMGRAGENPRQA